MRVSKQAVAENRRRILAAAARLFREHGIDGAGVDAITEAAGLTHGAFYSQFASKEAVVVEALRLVLDESNELWAQSANGTDKRAALDRIIDGYLSPRHRNSLGKGCAVAALGSDLPRQSKKVREVFTKRLEEGLEVFAGLVPAKTASHRRGRRSSAGRTAVRASENGISRGTPCDFIRTIRRGYGGCRRARRRETRAPRFLRARGRRFLRSSAAHSPGRVSRTARALRFRAN